MRANLLERRGTGTVDAVERGISDHCGKDAHASMARIGREWAVRSETGWTPRVYSTPELEALYVKEMVTAWKLLDLLIHHEI